MAFINLTDTLGQVFTHATLLTTGSEFLTLLIVMIVLMAICLMFGIPLEYTAIIILPLCIGYMSYYAEFWGMGIFLIFYISFIITKNWILK